MAPQPLTLLVPTTLPQATNLPSSGYCFHPFSINPTSALPLILWLITAILIVPCALFTISLHLYPDTVPLLTASQLPEPLELIYDGQDLKLPPLVPGPASAQKAKASLRFKIGLFMTLICLGLCVVQAMGIVAAQFCSGDAWRHGFWALPWSEWGLVSCGLTAVVLWSVWHLGSDWERLPVRKRPTLSHDELVELRELRDIVRANQSRPQLPLPRVTLRRKRRWKRLSIMPMVEEENGMLSDCGSLGSDRNCSCSIEEGRQAPGLGGEGSGENSGGTQVEV